MVIEERAKAVLYMIKIIETYNSNNLECSI